jgi:hypothetical protein
MMQQQGGCPMRGQQNQAPMMRGQGSQSPQQGGCPSMRGQAPQGPQQGRGPMMQPQGGCPGMRGQGPQGPQQGMAPRQPSCGHGMDNQVAPQNSTEACPQESQAEEVIGLLQ